MIAGNQAVIEWRGPSQDDTVMHRRRFEFAERRKTMTDFSNNYDRLGTECSASAKGFGKKLMFLLIGGGIGATLALLFAPKRGSELRSDIATMAGKSYEETLAAAGQLKKRSAEYYESAKQTGGNVLNVVTEGFLEVKDEVTNDIGNISAIVENTAKRAVHSATPTQTVNH